MWLGEKHGFAIDYATQLWVRSTGRRVNPAQRPWLDGPLGRTTGVGDDYFEHVAAWSGLTVESGDTAGIVNRFEDLQGPSFDPSRLHPRVRDFYEHTAAYEMDSWAQWRGLFRPFGWMLAVLFGRRLQQLNVPLSSLDTSRGITNKVLLLVDPTSGTLQYSAWVRKLIATGHVLYAGAYSPCRIPGHDGLCLKVVFPLPNGNGIVFMKPVVHEDGSLSLISRGRRFGEAGFYFTVHHGDGAVTARYVRALRESIHLYAERDGARADHVMKLWGGTFLRLHYRVRK